MPKLSKLSQLVDPQASKSMAKWGAILAIGGGIAFTASQCVLKTDGGMIYVIQNTLTPANPFTIYTEPGVHFRIPFFQQVNVYKQVMTINFDYDEKVNIFSSYELHQPAVNVRFADTYVGRIPATFRFKLSTDPEQLVRMHKDFRNAKNLGQTLLSRNARDVILVTATQYTGEEFFQGGLNAFKTQLGDQLAGGVYETERKQVEIDTMGLAPVGLNQDDSTKIKSTKQLVWKTVPVTDAAGVIKRAHSPLEQYGIEVTQVTLAGDPQPEEQLNRLLSDKKKLVADRIRAVQEQETSKAQAHTEQLKKEIQRTRAVQDAQREKELAIISQQREVEVARQVAQREIVEHQKMQDLAAIEKQKELEISKANLGIMKANSEAACFEAKAIMAKGEAETKVLSLRYKAKAQNKEIYLAEMQRDTAKVLYENLQNFNVKMPDNYINGDGSGKMTSNIDVITGLAALGMMHEGKKAQSNSSGGWFDKKE